MGKTCSTRMEDDIDGRLIFKVFISPPIRNQPMHYICIHETKTTEKFDVAVTLSDLCSKDLHLNFGRTNGYLD
jgi:hypothetical protein